MPKVQKMQRSDALSFNNSSFIKKPEWLRKPMGRSVDVLQLKQGLRGERLHTVCEEARCPNMGECFQNRVATVMIMGSVCTRSCKFCSVASGRPGPLDPNEPERVAQFIHSLNLRHVVITSVDRDDLPDLGAAHFAETILKTRELNPSMTLEVLTPDFQNRAACLDRVCEAGPQVFNHNLETVERLTRSVRSVARYDMSLAVLRYVKDHYPKLLTKSGLMLGLGEDDDEITVTLRDLRQAGVDIITLGQYLQPTRTHLSVSRYVHPDEFKAWEARGLEMGFSRVFSGPYVRSSYLADHVVEGLLG